MPTAGPAHTSPSRLSRRVRAAHGGTETADHHGPHANHTSTFSPTIPYSQRGGLLWDNSHMTELHPGPFKTKEAADYAEAAERPVQAVPLQSLFLSVVAQRGPGAGGGGTETGSPPCGSLWSSRLGAQ